MNEKVKLRVLMAQYSLSHEQVSEILGRSIKTVYAWTAKDGKTPPRHLVRLLELELKEREAATA